MKVKPAVPTRSECQGVSPDRPRAPQDYVTKNALAAIRPSTGPLHTPQPASLHTPLAACTLLGGMHVYVLRFFVCMQGTTREEGQADLLVDVLCHVLNV